jgi:peptidoglycan hydrolase-like protein with peptidoglycan-binding domain
MRNTLRRIAIGAVGAGMAVAITAGPAALAADAAVSAHSTAAAQQLPAALIWPLVHEGDSGLRVNAIQMLLIQRHVELTVDGKFGPQTETAVKSYQASHGISPSGKVGAKTWEALVVPLWKGRSGAAVSAVEIQLKYQYGFSSLSVDGKFGPMVKSAVKAFQKRYGLTPSGIVGERTWNALVLHDTK